MKWSEQNLLLSYPLTLVFPHKTAPAQPHSLGCWIRRKKHLCSGNIKDSLKVVFPNAKHSISEPVGGGGGVKIQMINY